MKKNLPIGMITDENFIMPTSVAITSIICNKSEDVHIVFHIIMAECSEKSKMIIQELNNLSETCDVVLIEQGLDKYRDIKQLQHIPISCLLKFDLCDLIPDYDKILYLDGDTIIRGDLWDLYNIDLEGKYAVGVKELQCLVEDKGNINAGVVVFNAKRIREERLSIKLFETRKSLGDRASMDQQSFNIVTNREYVYAPIRYNCVIGKLVGKEKVSEYTIDRINSLYGMKYSSIQDLYNDTVIIHFATSNKPWIYTFNPEAKEWYSYYLRSPFKNEPFELKGRWRYRFDKMVEAIEEEGIRGAMARINDKIRRTIDKNNSSVPWE